jgi:ligand-binding sensor domain-containing protein
LLVIGLVVATASDAFALDPHRSLTQYVHTHYEARNGLPHGLVNSIAQSADGYLWVGSEEGLARFDGTTFTTFDRRTTHGIPTNVFSALAVGGPHELWAGTRDRGIVQMLDGEFRSVEWAPGARELQVRALALDRDGDLWVGIRDRGVVHLRGGVLVGSLRAADGLPSEDVRTIFVARDGALWIGTFGGLAVIRNGHLLSPAKDLAGIAIHSITQDARGDLWCGTSRGLAHLAGDTVEWVGAESLAATEIRRVLFDRDGNLWIGTGKGVARRTPDGVIQTVPHIEATVLALFEDQDGDVWVGTEAGLDHLHDGDVVPVGEAEGATDQPVFGVREDSEGAIWIGSATGLLRIPPGQTAATMIAADRGTVYAIHERAPDDLWFGARDGSIGRWHTGQFAWIGRGAWEKVRALAETPAGMWLGTDHGLFRMVGDRVEDAEPVVPGPIINQILPDATGSLWLGTEGRGILRWRAGALVAVPAGGPPTSSSVTTIRFDADGTMWAGTEGDGLWRLQHDHWSVVLAKDGMFDDLVWRFLDDDSGRRWMSSNRGIWSVNRAELDARASNMPTELESVVYGETDGMRDRECNGAVEPAGWRARDGRLWFPTGKGLAVIDPAHLHPGRTPAALLESIRVDGELRRLGATLELAPGSNRIEVAYGAPALASPGRLRFRYRLEGFDKGWNEAGIQRIAQYTNLSPGSYRFVVEARTGSEWGAAGSIELRLRPHFYQTRWFIALAIVAGVFAIITLPMLRVRRLRIRALELDARVKEAVRELKVLSGMLPICAWCKKIRDDRGYWNKIEAYLGARTDAKFTHGICPDCETKMDEEEETIEPNPP